jgi:hypothetical protein
LTKLSMEFAANVTLVFTETGSSVNHATNHAERVQDRRTINASPALMSH